LPEFQVKNPEHRLKRVELRVICPDVQVREGGRPVILPGRTRKKAGAAGFLPIAPAEKSFFRIF
jgi:hypothetical protein